MTERWDVEQHTRLLAHAMRSVGECVSITDSDDLTLFVNDAFLRTYGYTQDELLGKSIAVVRSPQNPPELVAEILPATLRGGWAGELWNRRKDGSDFLVALSTSVVRDDDGQPLALIGVARDVTEERRLAESLEEERRFALQVMSAMGQGLTVTDAEGCFEYVNPAYAAMVGRTPEAMLGHSPEDFTIPQDHSVLSDARELRRQGLTSTYETRLRRADGDVVPVVITGVPRQRDGGPAGAIAVITDLTEHKRAEETLRASEERLAHTLRSLPVAVYTSPVGGDVDASWISENVLELTGFLPHFFLDTPRFWSERIHPEDRERTVAAFRAGPSTGHVNVEYRWQVADGSYRWFLDIAVTRRTARADHEVIGTFLDITERKQAEAALQRRDAILTAVAFGAEKLLEAPRWQECANEVLACLGQATEASRAYVFECRPAADGILLASQSLEWVAEGVAPQIDNPELQNIPVVAAGFGRWVEVLAAGGIIHGPVDGFPETERGLLESQAILSLAVVPIFVAGQAWGFIGFDDCRVRRAWPPSELEALRAAAGTLGAAILRESAERALRASEERYRTLVEMSPDGIAIAIDGRVVFYNTALARLAGLADLREGLGREVFEMLPEGDRAAARERYFLTAERDGVLPPFETTLRRRDGALIPVEIAQVPTMYAGKRAAQAVIRDLTERKRVEARLVEAQRLEVAALLAGGIAHEFNNLLQGILNTVQALRLGDMVQARFEQVVAVVEGLVMRGASLASELLLFARREVSKRERLDLADLFRAREALLRRLLPPSVELVLELPERGLWVEGDQAQLEHALINLVTNAGDVMPDGGRVTIRGELQGDALLAIEVRDTGPGIPDEVRRRIFEPFVTTKRGAKRAGLGLPVVHGIVTQHGGTVEIFSSPAAGTVARVVLPRAEPSQHPAGPASPTAGWAPPPGGSERILLVEDEQATRECLREVLTTLGYRVVAVASAEEAHAVTAAEGFDLLLTDLQLAGQSGGELSRSLASPDISPLGINGAPIYV